MISDTQANEVSRGATFQFTDVMPGKYRGQSITSLCICQGHMAPQFPQNLQTLKSRKLATLHPISIKCMEFAQNNPRLGQII